MVYNDKLDSNYCYQWYCIIYCTLQITIVQIIVDRTQNVGVEP